jgi:dolichol-phosphate mannosyltransferase
MISHPIVDDGSPDGTADIVKSLVHQFPKIISIEERKRQTGLGTAIHGLNGH